jgi:hypothetical protein
VAGRFFRAQNVFAVIHTPSAMEEPEYKASKKTSTKKKQKQKDTEEVNVDVNPKPAKKKPKKRSKKDRMQPLPPTPEEVEKARKKAIRVLFLHGLRVNFCSFFRVLLAKCLLASLALCMCLE